MGATSVTLELPTDPAQTQRLGDLGKKNEDVVTIITTYSHRYTLGIWPCRSRPTTLLILTVGTIWRLGAKYQRVIDGLYRIKT
ncbi:MAG: hypothetical protein R2822_14525 [Spirosomataceae bacterium]